VVDVVVVPPFGLAAAGAVADTVNAATSTGTLHATAQRRTDMVLLPPRDCLFLLLRTPGLQGLGEASSVWRIAPRNSSDAPPPASESHTP
jgi:hypothetical protein